MSFVIVKHIAFPTLRVLKDAISRVYRASVPYLGQILGQFEETRERCIVPKLVVNIFKFLDVVFCDYDIQMMNPFSKYWLQKCKTQSGWLEGINGRFVNDMICCQMTK